MFYSDLNVILVVTWKIRGRQVRRPSFERPALYVGLTTHKARGEQLLQRRSRGDVDNLGLA